MPENTASVREVGYLGAVRYQPGGRAFKEEFSAGAVLAFLSVHDNLGAEWTLWSSWKQGDDNFNIGRVPSDVVIEDVPYTDLYEAVSRSVPLFAVQFTGFHDDHDDNIDVDVLDMGIWMSVMEAFCDESQKGNTPLSEFMNDPVPYIEKHEDETKSIRDGITLHLCNSVYQMIVQIMDKNDYENVNDLLDDSNMCQEGRTIGDAMDVFVDDALPEGMEDRRDEIGESLMDELRSILKPYGGADLTQESELKDLYLAFYYRGLDLIGDES